MKKTDCFAYRDGGCIALKGCWCRNCSFYKTKEQHDRGRAAAFARIARLYTTDQYCISYQYYNGTYPWHWRKQA